MEEESKWHDVIVILVCFFCSAFICRAIFIFAYHNARNLPISFYPLFPPARNTTGGYIMKRLTIKQMALIGVLGAMANVLLLLRFPLPFMPPFMDFDLSGIPEIVEIGRAHV